MKTLLIALVLAGGPALAVQQTTPPAPAAAEDYAVGPQDVLALTVFNDDSMSRPALVVDSDGTIDCPLLGRMRVIGRTARQIEEDLRARYGPKRDAAGKVVGGIFLNPNLSVVVKEFRNQRVMVQGSVRTPGEVDLHGDPTLTRALAAAGYPTAESGSYVLITHAADGGRGNAVRPEDQVRVPRSEIENGRASRIRLRAGDTVFVPSADKFFIGGEVRSPGFYVLPADLTVMKALGVAGGPTDRANRRKIRIQRVTNGRQVEIKAEDSTVIMPGDTIIVHRRIF
jgi:polysaccharide export outer membrane protein